MPSKKKSGRSSSPRPSVALTKGDWLGAHSSCLPIPALNRLKWLVVVTLFVFPDVMDHDGVWNVARVLSVPSLEEVQVMYDGWPEEYDEVVRVDSDRVAPFHTFTWAVKCWVKYLNWPMWPSIITIRTPGTEEGIQNLAMENRFYVDFLDGPNFASRDRCWQKKRQVKPFDENYDRNRMGTNGAQFELALEYVLRSDATTKMPKFSRGTLPLQYDHLTTESVESMRENMGNGLWYRNFANNKGRHIRTHVYEMIGDEEEVPSSDESALAEKLQVRRPLTSATVDELTTPITAKKKKRPLLTQTQQLSVKIEQESPAEVPYELEPIDSDSDSGRQKEASLKQKRRLRVKARSVTSPVVIKSNPKKTKRSATSPDSNAASTMPRHVTVTMDEIIVDDDPDSDNSGIIPRKLVKKSHSEPAVSDDNEWEAEEKEVSKAIRKRVVRKDLASKKSVARRLSVQFSTRHRENEAALTKTQKSPKHSNPPASLIEQRIASAQEALKLHEEKLRAAEDVLVLGQQKRGSDSVSGSSDRSPSSMPRAEKKEPRAHQDQNAKMGSFLWVANSGAESLTGSELDGDRQAARFLRTRLDLGLNSDQVSHSFLSVDEAYSSDSQESKGGAAAFDDDVAYESQSEPEPSPKMHADDAKAMPKDVITVGSKQVAEEKGVLGDSEDESREVRRRFCVMRAGLEDALAVEGNEKAKTSTKRTMMSVPRKFDESVKKSSHVSTPQDEQFKSASRPAVFSSSDGFTMEKWLTHVSSFR